MIIATAGHVDHGKTSLVKALTGIDTDTLAEEKARGLTINLGYAYLPTDTGKPIGFIDVPGHHRFINNMIAGASSIDRALLIVAADDGVMPQTREHLDVLMLLGVQQIDIVITKIDRVSESQVASVSSASTSLILDELGTEPRLFHVSNTTGKGIDGLRTHLFDCNSDLEKKKTADDETCGFRLSIDRRFHVKGAGVVVTGTASAGRVSVGDTLSLLPRGVDVRVKEVRANDVQDETASAGQRVALCVSGKVELNDIDRGDLLVDPDFCDMSERIDVSLKLLPRLSRPLKHLTPVKVHIGAKRLSARIALIDKEMSKLAPGESSKAQLILQEALCATNGERFVIRDDSEMETLAGGFVLDPAGPKYGKSKTDRLEWLDALENADIALAANALIQQGHCVDFEQLTTCFNRKDVMPSTLTPEDCVSFQARGKRWITKKSNLAKTRKSLVDAVQISEEDGATPKNAAATHQPAITNEDAGRKQPGIVKDKLLALAGRSTHPALAEATLAILVKQGELANTDGRIRLPTSLDAHNPHDALWQSLEDALQTTGLNVPVISEARSQARLSDVDIKIAIKQGRERGLLHRVNAERFVLTQTLIQFAEAAEKTVETEPLSVVAFKNQLGIGRRLAIEILEYFDGIGFTRRSGDHRTIVNRGVIEKRFVT